LANSVWLNAGASSPILWPDGTAALPGAAFVSEPSSGLYRASAGVVSMQVLGVSRFSADTSLSNVRGPDGGAYFYVGNGTVTVNSSTLIFASGGSAYTSFILPSATTGLLNLANAANSAGVGFDVATDAIMKVRTRAQSGYATIDALGYKASGVAGVATFGPSVVTSITVTGGIITAIS
jgi:hypothetical protein